MTPQDLQQILSAYRFSVSCEADLQSDVETVLTSLDLSFTREFPLPGGPVDFCLEDGLAIECKVTGSPTSVLRQVLRYISQPKITGLLLVTSKSRHCPKLTELGGKPFARLWVGNSLEM